MFIVLATGITCLSESSFILPPKKTTSSRAALKQEIGDECRAIFNCSIKLLKLVGKAQAENNIIGTTTVDIAHVQDYASRLVSDLIDQGSLLKKYSREALQELLIQVQQVAKLCKEGKQYAKKTVQLKRCATTIKTARSTFEKLSLFSQKHSPTHV